MDKLYKDWRRFDAPLKQCHSIKKMRQERLWRNYCTGEPSWPHQIKTNEAFEILRESFQLAEDDHRENAPVKIPEAISEATKRLFTSVTQAYREALVGCAIARVANQDIDIRLPATADGEHAFSGRSLADHVVTPFLRDRAIPISASPYLSALRGGAKFTKGGAPRIQRDKDG